MPQKSLEKQEILKTLHASWKEGAAANAMIASIEYYLIPYGLYLGASVMQIGLLVAIPQLLGAISQLFSLKALNIVPSRVKFLTRGALIHTIVLLGLSLLVLWPGQDKITILIILSGLYRILLNMLGSVWGSLVSEYLPAHTRGIYFGWRSQIVGFAGLFAVIWGGVILQVFKEVHEGLGFFLVFLTIAAARALSSHYMAQHVDIPHEHNPEHQFTFWQFLKRFRESNFGRFVFYMMIFTFATYVSAPYFAVYMLKELHFSYATYMSVNIVAMVGGLFAFPIWGKHADVIGNVKMLKLSSVLIPFIPLLWILSQNIYYLWTLEFISGMLWSGFQLCAVNFIFEAVTAQKRVQCLSYFTLLNGIALFIGSAIGGWISPYLWTIKGSHLLCLFLISGLLRLIAHLVLFQRFHEVRSQFEKISSWRVFFSVTRVRPIVGLSRGWNAMLVLDKVLSSQSEQDKK